MGRKYQEFKESITSIADNLPEYLEQDCAVNIERFNFIKSKSDAVDCFVNDTRCSEINFSFDDSNNTLAIKFTYPEMIVEPGNEYFYEIITGCNRFSLEKSKIQHSYVQLTVEFDNFWTEL